VRSSPEEFLVVLTDGSASLEEIRTAALGVLTLVVEQARIIEEQAALIEDLRRQIGRDSSNSSRPAGADDLGARARRRAEARKKAKDNTGTGRREQGGQKGHRGSALTRAAHHDRTVVIEPADCSGCGAHLTGEAVPGPSTQVLDIPEVRLTCTEYRLTRRECACGGVTTAAWPSEVTGGPVCYGPNVVAAATLLACSDVIGLERAADLMGVLLGAPVSTGFIVKCLERLDDRLVTDAFEDALKEALTCQDVRGTDETPAPVSASGSEAARRAGGQDCANPHVDTVRTMNAFTFGGPDLVWFGAAGDRTKKSIGAFGILEAFEGVLVRDDYGGYVSYDEDLAGVQQCLSHIWRHLQDVGGIDSGVQVWTAQAADALYTAARAARTARAAGTGIDPGLLAKWRASYDQAVACGISVNVSRRWAKGNHPGLTLARRLKRKAEQVWLFTTRLDVPATNNGSEQAIRGFKLAAKVKGCWRSLATLQRHCLIRSYLISARNHGLAPLAAIRDALDGRTWMPPAPA
jgi:transposase